LSCAINEINTAINVLFYFIAAICTWAKNNPAINLRVHVFVPATACRIVAAFTKTTPFVSVLE